jgi:UDP:flavonoid glycosyltransferase YjiC (YdhE family)
MSRPRVLVTCFPQSGHLHPLIPIARALADAGCAVLVATSASQHAILQAAGLEAVDLGPSHEETSARRGEVEPEVMTAAPSARRAILFSFIFGKTYAPAIADDLLQCARSWQADVLLSGLESLAGPLVAAQLRRPLVVSGFGTGLAQDVCDAAARTVAPLWERAGLRVSPAAGIFDGLYVDPCPPSLHPDDVPIARRSQLVRPAQFDGDGHLPTLPTRRPRIYITFGTNRMYATPTRLRMLAEAVVAAGASAVITGLEPRELGSLPEGVVAHHFVPQSALLPHCDAVICHAGASTVLGALTKGLPLLLLPLGADHFANAGAAVRRGVAVALEGDMEASSVEAAIARVLTDRALRTSAAEVAEEIAAMPSPATAADGVLAWLDEQAGPHYSS